MAEGYVPHFHNTPGVAVIEIGARVQVRGRSAALRSPARLSRHGRCDRDDLSVLLDPVPVRSRSRSLCRATAGMCSRSANGRRRSVVGRADRGPARRSPASESAGPQTRSWPPSSSRRRHRRAHCRAGARPLRISCGAARAGTAAGGDRRRDPALPQRLAHSDRARRRRAAEPACRRPRGIAGDERAHRPRAGVVRSAPPPSSVTARRTG